MEKVIIYFVFIVLFFSAESKIEKLFRKKGQDQKIEYEEKTSIKFFKSFQFLISIVSSIEFAVLSENRNLLVLNMAFGLLLVITGIYLRIKAIKTLGIYWSYNIKILAEHKIGETGIYKFIKHPAYLGNIYILGIFLISNLYYTITISCIFLAFFSIYRIKKENRLLSEIEYVNREENTSDK